MHPVHYFGRWSPDPRTYLSTPVGKRCGHCTGRIEKDDNGLYTTFVKQVDGALVAREEPVHRACFMRHVIGSVAHQFMQCTCFGGSTRADPPTLWMCRQLGWRWVLRFWTHFGRLNRKLSAQAALELHESRNKRPFAN